MAALIPMEAIGRAADFLQMNPVFRACAAWAAGEDHMIPGVKSVFRQTVPDQPPAAAPFRGPCVHFPLRVQNLHGHERMRIAEIEINQLTFDRDALVFKSKSRRTNDARKRARHPRTSRRQESDQPLFAS